jgi:hypothetical protein
MNKQLDAGEDRRRIYAPGVVLSHDNIHIERKISYWRRSAAYEDNSVTRAEHKRNGGSIRSHAVAPWGGDITSRRVARNITEARNGKNQWRGVR